MPNDGGGPSGHAADCSEGLTFLPIRKTLPWFGLG